jgi:hypothetical protein
MRWRAIFHIVNEIHEAQRDGLTVIVGPNGGMKCATVVMNESNSLEEQKN